MTMRFGRFLRQNTIALLALFLALGGTTFAAANAPPRNSVGTRQLKNNAVTSPKIKNDQVTGADVRESSLGKVPSAANADHAASADSATNATHATTADTAAPTGTAGGALAGSYPNPTFAGVLPPGNTLRGNYMVAAANGGFTSHSAVSYGFRLPAAPTANYIMVGGTPPAACPGSATNPQAAPGNLCLYEVQATNVSSFRGQCDPDQDGCPFDSSNRDGFAVYAEVTDPTSPMYVFGSWAVTAGAAAGPAHKPEGKGASTIR